MKTKKQDLMISTGTEGSSYDPTAYTEYSIVVDGVKHALRDGLVRVYKLDGAKVSWDAQAMEDFEKATGISNEDLLIREQELYEPLVACSCCGGALNEGSGLGDEPVAFCDNDNCEEPYFWSHPEPWKFCM